MFSRIVGSIRRFWQGAEPRYFPSETRLRDIPDMCPAGFTTGIELFNDPATPMDFVVNALMRHCSLSKKEACRIMLDVHVKGGALIPTTSEAAAISTAKAISDAAETAGHPLTCRPSL